jgi:hypothetical protein
VFQISFTTAYDVHTFALRENACAASIYLQLKMSFAKTDDENASGAGRTGMMVRENDYAFGLRLLSVRLESSSMS